MSGPQTPQKLLSITVLFVSVATVPLFAFTVSEKSGAVSVAENVSGQQNIETSAGSHAQVDLGKSVIRLGADSTLRLNGNDAVGLSKGTCLFDFVGRNQQLLLDHAGKQATVKGGTGFARIAEGKAGQPEVLLIGALAGKVVVLMNGQSHGLSAGELIAFDGKGDFVTSGFNLAKLSETASLLKDFQSPLPDHAAVQREVNKFASLQKRGFIQSRTSGDTQRLLASRSALPPGTEIVALAAPSSSSISSLTASAPSLPAEGVTLVMPATSGLTWGWLSHYQGSPYTFNTTLPVPPVSIGISAASVGGGSPSIYSLPGSGAPSTTGVSWSLLWDMTIQGGGTAIIGKDKQLGLVGLQVPTPLHP